MESSRTADLSASTIHYSVTADAGSPVREDRGLGVRHFRISRRNNLKECLAFVFILSDRQMGYRYRTNH